MKCPSCSLENPPTAAKCDCGCPLVVFPSSIPAPVVLPRPGFVRIVWLAPMIGAFIAAADLYVGLSASASAPQQAAAAGMALAWVVIPYCFARAVMGLAGY